MNSQRGASVLEVIFAIAVVLAITPFMFNQISEMSRTVHDIAAAKEITSLRDDVLDYVRQNQESWTEPNNPISTETLNGWSPSPSAGIVVKENIQGATATEAYLVFTLTFKHGDTTKYRVADVARYIGPDAAVVQSDGVAYSDTWGVEGSTNFPLSENQLVFRIARDFEGENKNAYLHRSSNQNGLNKMERPLHLKNNIGLINIRSVNTNEVISGSINSNQVDTESVNTAGKFNVLDKITFSKGVGIGYSSIDFANLIGMGGNGSNDLRSVKLRGFETLNIRNKDETAFMAGNVETFDSRVNGSFVVNQDLTLKANGRFSGFDINVSHGSIFAQDISVNLLQLSGNAELAISRTKDGNEITGTHLVIGVGANQWRWPDTLGPTLRQLNLTMGDSTFSLRPVIEVNGYYVVTKLNLAYGNANLDSSNENTIMGRLLHGCLRNNKTNGGVEPDVPGYNCKAIGHTVEGLGN